MWVVLNGCLAHVYSVMGELAVSRAFGDVDFKKGIQSIIEQEGGLQGTGGNDGVDMTNWDQPLIIAEPDVEVFTYAVNTIVLFKANPPFMSSA